MSNVAIFPEWKKNSTPAEWLYQMAQTAEAHPEEWATLILVSKSEESVGCFSFGDERATQRIGMLELAKAIILKESA